MGTIGGVIAVVSLVAVVVHAAPLCSDDEGHVGAQLRLQGEQLVVGTVAPDSPAAAATLQSGDIVVQANATVVHGCGEWTKAVRDARDDHKAVLLLIERRGIPLALVVPAGALDAAPSAPSVAAVPVPSRPSPATLPAPPPLPETVNVSYESLRQNLDQLAPADHLPTSLTDYRHAVSQLRRGIATLAARRLAPSDATNALRVALRPFEAGEVAWDAIEGERERDHRTRRVPFADAATAPYFEDSQTAAVLDEFPFLRPTVAKDPEPGFVETSGQWRPVQARHLLWEYGRTQLQGLPATR